MPEYYDDFEVSFEELVLMCILEEDTQYECHDDQTDDRFDVEENEDYLSLSEYYLSR